MRRHGLMTGVILGMIMTMWLDCETAKANVTNGVNSAAPATQPTGAPASRPAGTEDILSRGGTVLMIGDSFLDFHTGDQRVEVAAQRILAQRAPHAAWKVINLAHGGEYIGPKEGEPGGVSGPLFSSETTGRYFDVIRQVPHAEVIVINYGGNDSKVYSPEVFGKKLDSLCQRLKKQYPGATIILCTSMYLDPRHCAPYRLDKPMVPGWKNGLSRNDYFGPYIDQVCRVAAERGYRLADTRFRMKEETNHGNWDLRVRGDGNGDPKDDSKHAGDLAWFSNVHPNAKCTELIAGVIVDAMAQ